MNTPQEVSKKLCDALTAYVDTLARGTTFANDRPLLEHHLARAAEMFSAIHQHDMERLKHIADSEVRYFGHTYIRSPEGEAVSAAWERFGQLLLNKEE